MRAHWMIPLLALTVFAADYHAPAGDSAPNPRPGAVTVLPGGRILQPLGRQYATGPGPFGIAVSPDQSVIATADGGPDEFSVSILKREGQGRYRMSHMVAPEEGSEEGRSNTWRGVYMGIAFAGNNEVFVSEGDPGRVRRFQLGNRDRSRIYELNTGEYRDSYAGELSYDQRRRVLYVIDQANERLVILDAEKGRTISSVKVGRLPFAIALSPDEKRVYVTNLGMFDYQGIPGGDIGRPVETGLPFPAFGFPSPEATQGVQRDTAQGSTSVPPLGHPNDERSNSLCVINVEDPSQPKVIGFVPTGTPWGGEILGGSSPSGVLAAGDRVYVANAHNDSITVIDAATLERVKEIPIRVPGLESLRGVMPVGLAYHAGSRWLLVAEAGINAVGVIDTESLAAVGHLPAAWAPGRIAVAEDTVYVANARGHGTGANANRMIRVRGEPFHQGAITFFPIPAARDLPKLTRLVIQSNGFEVQETPPPSYPPEIRHVVLIVKKSRSFDEVLGDVEQTGTGKVDAAPMLARFGRYGSAVDSGGGFRPRFWLRGVNMTPNHHDIALRWSFSDNFHADSETEADGRHWLAGAPPNAWTLTGLMAAAAGMKSYRPATTATGRLAYADGASALLPEEVPENGTLWDHLKRHGVSFRNFGEGLDLPGVYRGERMAPTGARYLTNVPMPEALYGETSRSYPLANTNIPDQYRATQFIDQIEADYRRPGRELPRFLYVQLPNDQMAIARPDDGYPFTASYVADNDYALGRIVEYLSKTPWWPNMVIFVTEDSAEGGVDHVDSHRTVLLAAGPYVKKNYVSHRNVSFPGLLKTVFGLLGLPPLNLFDAAATDLGDCFTATGDMSPYEAELPRKELFVPEKARVK